MRRNARGFTLIELMIVLVVAAIIITIAIPAFTSQMRKSRRSEVLSQLQSLALNQEQYRASNVSYASNAQLTTFVGAAAMTSTHYTLAVSGESATGYTITGTAKLGDDQNNDKASGSTCAALTLVSLNGSVSKSPTSCWQ